MNKFVIIVLFGILLIILFCYSNRYMEGQTPLSNSSPSPDQTKNISALDKFTAALVTAFSPPAVKSPPPSAKPAWENVKVIADPVVGTINSPSSCGSSIQFAVDPLPVDVQAQTTITNHSTTIISALDAYELQLSKIENIINKPERILSLNKNIESVVNLGVPLISVVYDDKSNTMINLSVVKGVSGDKGSQPDQIPGIGVDGEIGSVGVDGINPINSSYDKLPYWAK